MLTRAMLYTSIMTTFSSPRALEPTRAATFWAGVRDESPILVGTVPFGLIYGVTAVKIGVQANVAQAMSAIVFAGSSQFIAAQLIGAGAPALLIVVTALVVNLRHALYSASLAPYTRHLPRGWQWLLAYLLTDEAYAVAITHYRTTRESSRSHWYFLGAGLALWSSWQVSTFVGVYFGGQLPSSWGLDFTLPLTFIALVFTAIKDRASVTTTLVAGAVAVLAFHLPFKSSLIVAALCGVAAGMLIDRTRTRHPARDAAQSARGTGTQATAPLPPLTPDDA